MALDMFLTIDDGAAVKGETKDDTGKVNAQDLSLTKWVDSATPVLMSAIATGKHFGKAKLVVRKAGDKPLEYLVIEMEHVMVTSLSTGGSGGEDRLTENVTLNFAKVKVEYVCQKEKGEAGDKIPMTYDFSVNKK
jgi:type VI secretion system secreted protein Hcp